MDDIVEDEDKINWRRLLTTCFILILLCSLFFVAGYAQKIKHIENQANEFIAYQEKKALNNTCFRQCMGIPSLSLPSIQ